MALRPEEARVLACLIEKEATVPDSYPLTLNMVRLACNQTSNRHPIVSYDDRTVDTALLSLKSMGLVRFVHPAHGGRTTRYRHTADERWHLSPAALGVLAVLVLRGPQTAGEVRARVERQIEGVEEPIDELLDELASRKPEPLITRLELRSGEREARFAHFLLGEVDDVAPLAAAHRETSGAASALTELTVEVAALRARLDRLEALLGVTDDDANDDANDA